MPSRGNAGKWHTKLEKKLIKRHGGLPLRQWGYDGEVNGKPVEVRAAVRDDRFKISKDMHNKLLKNKGNYIFSVRNGKGYKSKLISAKEVSNMLGHNSKFREGKKWFSDNHGGKNWAHRFLGKEQIFD